MIGPMRRAGFSLIELIVAMVATTVLVVALASCVVISTELLETPLQDADQQHDRLLADRLMADLRYATAVESEGGDSFRIARPDPLDGSTELIAYAGSMEGLTRQVDGGAAAIYDDEAPNHAFQLDQYSAPPRPAAERSVRLRGTSKASTLVLDSSLPISIPPGCVTDDLLLLCVAAKSPSMYWLSESGWQTVNAQGVDDLRMVVLYRFYDPSVPESVTVWVDALSSIAAVMLCIENVDRGDPISWLNDANGYSYWYAHGTHPRVRESSGISDAELNVQVFAGENVPWDPQALGVASFTDAAQETSGLALPLLDASVGVVIRSGPLPAMSTTPRLWQGSSGYWLQTGIHLGARQ